MSGAQDVPEFWSALTLDDRTSIAASGFSLVDQDELEAQVGIFRSLLLGALGFPGSEYRLSLDLDTDRELVQSWLSVREMTDLVIVELAREAALLAVDFDFDREDVVRDLRVGLTVALLRELDCGPEDERKPRLSAMRFLRTFYLRLGYSSWEGRPTLTAEQLRYGQIARVWRRTAGQLSFSGLSDNPEGHLFQSEASRRRLAALSMLGTAVRADQPFSQAPDKVREHIELRPALGQLLAGTMSGTEAFWELVREADRRRTAP